MWKKLHHTSGVDLGYCLNEAFKTVDQEHFLLQGGE